MINTRPLEALLVEKEMTIRLLSQLTGIEEHILIDMKKGKCITNGNLDAICSVLQCQPCDIIEYSPSDTKGHWVYVEEKKE